MRISPAQHRVRRGFTLVEMLVVITIIGILAGLAIPAVIVARNRAKVGAMVMDIKQLEMACQAYKEKFGEYPPDFAFVPGATITPAAPTTPLKLRRNRLCCGIWRGHFPGMLPGSRAAARAGLALHMTSMPWGLMLAG